MFNQVIQPKVKPRNWSEFPKNYQFVKAAIHGPGISDEDRITWFLVNERGQICLQADSLEMLQAGFSYRYPILPTDPDYDSDVHGVDFLLYDNVSYIKENASMS